VGHSTLVQVDDVLLFGGKENLLDLLWSDRDGLAFGIVSYLGAIVQEVRDAEEGLGQANLHLHLGGVILMDPLCCSVEVGMHDLNVSLNWKNVTQGQGPQGGSGPQEQLGWLSHESQGRSSVDRPPAFQANGWAEK
jgi:hypothetical protein